jgi:hypothetical protein
VVRSNSTLFFATRTLFFPEDVGSICMIHSNGRKTTNAVFSDTRKKLCRRALVAWTSNGCWLLVVALTIE